MESLNDKLAKIVISYNQLRAEYHGTEDISNQDLLMGYRDRFVRLQGEIIPIYKYIVRDKVRHDEKACSTIKARIATR